MRRKKNRINVCVWKMTQKNGFLHAGAYMDRDNNMKLKAGKYKITWKKHCLC